MLNAITVACSLTWCASRRSTRRAIDRTARVSATLIFPTLARSSPRPLDPPDKDRAEHHGHDRAGENDGVPEVRRAPVEGVEDGAGDDRRQDLGKRVGDRPDPDVLGPRAVARQAIDGQGPIEA